MMATREIDWTPSRTDCTWTGHKREIDWTPNRTDCTWTGHK